MKDSLLDEIRHRFSHHPPSDARASEHQDVRVRCRELALELTVLLPACREKSLAITKLEEAMFWANAAIARNPKETE